MADPASLTLGILPIAATLLSACLTGYELFSAISSTGEDAQILLCRLQIEQTRLVLWTPDLEADGPSLDEQLNQRGIRNLIILVLAHMCAMFTNTKKLKADFGLSHIEMSHQNELRIPVPSLPSFPRIMANNARDSNDAEKTIQRFAKETQQSLSLIQKLRFSLRDKKRFVKLLEQLQYFNDSLVHLLAPAHRTRLDLTLSSKVLDTTREAHQLERIKDASQDSYNPLSSTATLKRARLLIESSATQFISASELRCSEDLTLSNPSAQRSLGSYGKVGAERSIIAEWKDYDRNMPREISIERIQDIARYLFVNSSHRSSDLPFPECIGYLEDIDQSRCCFIYQFPEDLDAQGIQELSSLADLMPKEFNSSMTPNLENRLALARALALAIFRLHLTGWLHKGIRSSNIVFFRLKAKGDLPAIAYPNLMGFDYSRPNRPNAVSDRLQPTKASLDLYVHPLYQQQQPHIGVADAGPASTTTQRYDKSFDIYSLGLVLLEIALWQPISSFYQKNATTQEFQDAIMDVVRTELGHVMGGIYREVVSACLRWELSSPPSEQSVSKQSKEKGGEKEEEEEKASADTFLQRVVTPLFECP